MSFLERLADQSGLTNTQIQALVMYRSVKAGQITLKEAAKRMPKPMKIGSYYRIVQQGKENLKQSLMTQVAGLWLGYLKREDLVRLIELASKTPEEMDETTQTRVSDLFATLVSSMVM